MISSPTLNLCTQKCILNNEKILFNHDCESILEKVINSPDYIKKLENFYLVNINLFSVKRLCSTTIINWNSCIDELFDDFLEVIFGCLNLRSAVLDLYEDFDDKLNNVIRLETIAKVSIIMYWNKNIIWKLMLISKNLDKKYWTDYFSTSVNLIDNLFNFNLKKLNKTTNS